CGPRIYLVNQLNRESIDIFQAQTIWGSAKIPAELQCRAEVRLLRRWRQIADRHVLDHAAAKRADLSHRKTSCLKGWALTPTILSDRRRLLRPPLNCRASGFVQSFYEFMTLDQRFFNFWPVLAP